MLTLFEKKKSKTAGIINKLKDTIPLNALINIYNSLVLSESESESEYCLFTQKQKQKYITIHIKDFVNGGRHPKDMKCRYRGATRDRGTAFGDPSC